MTAMTPARWQRVKELYAAAVDAREDEREGLLALQAGEDTELIAEVQSLLDSHQRPSDYLEPMPNRLRAEAFAATTSASNHEGERIGSYRVVGTLGSGGMGDVFRSVRDDDVYRAEVAIKLMRADVRNPLAEQRFRTERQILAELDHRNIARLLDGGTTTSGLPYVVMELVAGEPIDLACDARNLSVRERVQLFLQVCAAVSYAHQHLVVHRDLKPNNILVTADGSVKLLDFGIAKLIEANEPATASTENTVTQLRAMTLDYASPEQVSGGTVTTVSDVYSLGVVLYRLLTGQSPYGVRANDAQRVKEILSDTTPTRPSQVTTSARPRQHEIDADLDNILLMALRKEPQQRYGSVEAFANDLRNFLNGLPVYARGNALRYRLGKFVRRRKIEIAAGVIVALSLVGGMGIAIREAREADRQRLVAQRHFDSVRKMANTLLFDLHDEIAKQPGNTKAREMLVKTSVEYLDSLYKESGSDRALRAELGVAYSRVAAIQGSDTGANTGDTQSAKRNYARAVELLAPLVAAEPENHAAAISLAKTYLQQGKFLLITEGAGASLTAVEKSLALSEKHKAFFTDDNERATTIGTAYWARANALGALNRIPEGVESIDRMVAICEEYAAAHPGTKRAYEIVESAYNNAAISTDPRMPLPEAFARASGLLQKSLAAALALLALEPANLEYQWSVAETRFNLADALNEYGEHAKAVDMFRLAAEGIRSRSIDPNDARGQWIVAAVDSGLARALAKIGGLDEATSLFAAAEKRLAALAKNGGTLQIDFALAQVRIRRGEMLEQLANNPHLSAAVRREHSRLAHESLEQGIASARKVNEVFPLEGVNKRLLDDGVASLARLEGTLAAFTPAR